MGELTFNVSPIKCFECDFDFSTDEQIIYEIYLNMVERSKLQHERQRDKYLDWYKQFDICPECNSQLIFRAKFTKIHNFIQLEAVTYPIEKDARWIAAHTKP